jgi:hypothetical protein
MSMFRATLLGAVLMLSFVSVCSASEPLSLPVANEAPSSTLDKAAIQALRSAIKVSTVVEEAGALYTLGGKFYYTSAASNSDEAHFAIRIGFPQGAKLVALYHTHPNHENNDMFSPNDVNIANQMHVISYVGVLTQSTSHIIKYIPGVSKMGSCARCGGSPLDYFHKVSTGTTIAPL